MARAAVVSSVQTGTATSNADGTLTVPITSVNPAKAALFFDASFDSNRPTSSAVGGRIASATTLEFVRNTNETPPAPMSIRWYVVEWTSGVNVQRGLTGQSGTVINVPITAVAAVNQAFVTWSKTPQKADQNNLDGDDPILAELTSTTNLQIRVDTLRPQATIYWQVVEFTNAADIRVQKGSTSLIGAALSVDVTLPVANAVNVASTFVLVGYNTSSGVDPAVGDRMVRAQLINSTTIRIDRSIGGPDLTEIHWQAVELKDGSEVLRGNASFAAGTATTVTGFGGRRVNLNGAVAFASVQVESGLNMGKTSYAGDDVVGVCSVRSTLAPTNLTLTRSNTADTCDVGWFVVQFAPTSTTAVTLQSFTATVGDGEVLLRWETGSELNNLGFQLYRAASETGPWGRITSSLIPGLGSSPDGAQYAYRDTGLANGATLFYLLEDVETTGKTTRHGPVSATPRPGVAAAPPADPATPAPADDARASIRFGEPEATSLNVLQRQGSEAVVELRTGGFYALPDSDGSVYLSIPGFEEARVAGDPGLPVKLAWIEAVVGRKVQIASTIGSDVVAFSSLRPSVVGEPAVYAAPDGTLSPRSRMRAPGAEFRAKGLYPEEPARLAGTAFQGDVKKAELELSPLRWDRSSGQLLLARRLLVRVVFAGQEAGEVSRGGSRGLGAVQGKKAGGDPASPGAGVVARLIVRDRGLQAVTYEQIFGTRGRVPAADLRLSRQGETVAHHVEPDRSPFGPGSVLYFVSDGPSVNPHGNELVYELSLAGGGAAMPVDSAAPRGAAVAEAWTDQHWEVDKPYLPGLLQAESPWLWDTLLATMSKSYPMELAGVASSSEPARLTVWLQGGSDFPSSPDHHVRVRVNGSTVGEARWDGQTPQRLEAELPSGTLAEGSNLFEIENVGDRPAPYSVVYLDWYELRSARQLVAQGGSFEGVFHAAGSAEIRGLPLGTMLVDTTEPVTRWLVDTRSSPLGVSFQAQAGRRYLAVSPRSARSVGVRAASPSLLHGSKQRADYLVLAPREFLGAAEPLLEQRRRQGLETMAVAIEDVYDDFGFGEAHPEAVRTFLEYAYHGWERAPRYVLLVGDASYDFKDNLHTGTPNRVPPYLIKDAYLWTVSDPDYALVNGSDLLPDLALGRLPAANLAEAQRLVQKVLAWESAGFDLSGRAVVVADNTDAAGDFEGDSERLATTLLSGRPVERIYLSQLGEGTRPAIAQGFDAGASVMSYVGHGGTAVWASENVWNTSDVARLAPQAEQPFLMAMDCLNGFFHQPRYNSLAEELLKAEGKGVIGTLAPSSLSVHWAADVYLEALTRELVSGRHQRLGDALLAAQVAYIEAGARPELLRSYQLLADPALPLRR